MLWKLYFADLTQQASVRRGPAPRCSGNSIPLILRSKPLFAEVPRRDALETLFR